MPMMRTILEKMSVNMKIRYGWNGSTTCGTVEKVGHIYLTKRIKVD